MEMIEEWRSENPGEWSMFSNVNDVRGGDILVFESGNGRTVLTLCVAVDEERVVYVKNDGSTIMVRTTVLIRSGYTFRGGAHLG